jgi:hypothetical protein
MGDILLRDTPDAIQYPFKFKRAKVTASDDNGFPTERTFYNDTAATDAIFKHVMTWNSIGICTDWKIERLR